MEATNHTERRTMNSLPEQRNLPSQQQETLLRITTSDLTAKYAPNMIAAYAQPDAARKCVLSQRPTMTTIFQQTGYQPLREWYIGHLTGLIEVSGLVNKPNDFQLTEAASTLMQKTSWMKITELMHFLYWARTNIKFYGAFSTAALIEGLEIWCRKVRAKVLYEEDNRLREQLEQEHKAKVMAWRKEIAKIQEENNCDFNEARQIYSLLNP